MPCLRRASVILMPREQARTGGPGGGIECAAINGSVPCRGWLRTVHNAPGRYVCAKSNTCSPKRQLAQKWSRESGVQQQQQQQHIPLQTCRQRQTNSMKKNMRIARNGTCDGMQERQLQYNAVQLKSRSKSGFA